LDDLEFVIKKICWVEEFGVIIVTSGSCETPSESDEIDKKQRRKNTEDVRGCETRSKLWIPTPVGSPFKEKCSKAVRSAWWSDQ